MPGPKKNFEEVFTDKRSITDTGADVSLSSNQDIPNTTTTKVQFDNENDDDGSHFDTSTDFEFTVPRDGDYSVQSNVEWGESLSDGTKYNLLIFVNGSFELRNRSFTSGANLPGSNVSYTLKNLTSGDTISVRVFHDDGQARMVSGSTDRRTSVSINQEA